MAIHLKRTLIIFATLVVIMQITKGQDESPAESEEDDSSSAQTVENSNESRKRRRRSVETTAEGTEVSAVPGKAGLPSIPGLPDPATIVKIAEILTTVGQQVLPILVSGNSGVEDLVSNRVAHDMKFLKKFKNELDALSEELIKRK